MTIRLNVKMRSCRGFTLLELLFSMAISGIIMSSVYFIYSSQQRSYLVQEQVASMQQNLRAALDLMEREIRMAGYDPTGDADAKIIKADTAELQFRIDFNEDGDFSNPSPPPANDPNEQIRYALTKDGDKDGIADGSPCHLGRETWGGGLRTVAENIDTLDFVYLDERFSDGIDNDGDGTIDEYDEAIMAIPVTNTEDIRAVQITLVARTERVNPTYTDTGIYTNQQGTVILPQQNDNFRRKRLTAQVCCRNLAF